MPHRTLLFAALLAAGAVSAAEPASEQATLQALSERLRLLEQRLGTGGEPVPAGTDPVAALDQRLRILERQLEIQQEEAVTRATSTPVVAVGDKGLSVNTPKGDYEIRFKGLVQADHRAFLGDDAPAFNDGFLFRRIRPSFEGSLGPLIGFRLTPEFAGDSATIVDAYVDVKFDPRYTLRVGKLKGPVGLERLQSGGAIALIERGFPTELAPNRDLGAQLQGELAQGRVSYAAGVFNGAPDGRDAPTTDPDGELEFAGRLFFEPWKNDANALSGLGFGLAGSVGDKQGAGNSFLPRYRTPGQNVFFNYRATVLADGRHTRISPQAFYYRNAFGLQAEAIRSEQEVALAGNPASRTELSHDAWQLTGSWVLTGEDAGYRGVVKPSRPYTVGGEGWGAFELVARYGELDVDDDAFGLYADPNASASRATAWGLGLNWYLNSNLKLVLNHTRASFDGGAAGGADREDESTVFTRLQLAF
ncbi:OprO/OprP family phosphate-selective porin [Arenimonas sp. MALMAid1274]|uniref:OprO/OprP family phosphate-selective porin n=1 Tax=Arenimonas sp. MALMAid1274 TaxID=3411630 RepID=UPI003BA07CB1